jgi:hypothetical protein
MEHWLREPRKNILLLIAVPSMSGILQDLILPPMKKKRYEQPVLRR